MRKAYDKARALSILGALLALAGCSQPRSVDKKDAEKTRKTEVISDQEDKASPELKGSVIAPAQAPEHSPDPEKYAAALNDPGNILEARTEPLSPADAVPGGTLRRPMGSNPRGYNWLTENGADIQELQTYVHNTFATRDPVDPDKWVPELAYKIEISDDNLTYTIHLREDVYWQVPNVDFASGKYDWLKVPRNLTAEDAVFYFEMIQNPKVQAGAIKSYYEGMDKVEVIDKYTFRVTWNEQLYQSKEFTIGAYPLPKWLFTRNENGSDIPESWLGSRFNSHWASRYPIGTGPYRVADIRYNQRILLEQNERYWDTKPPIEQIEYQIIPDPNTVYLKLIGGDLDFTELTPPIYRQDVRDAGPKSPFKSGVLKYAIITRPVYYYIGWNADRAIFSDSRVRTAMTHALDREGIIKNVLSGLGRPTSGPFLPDHPANNPEVTRYSYDLKKAADLLKEAGWEDTDGDGTLDKIIAGKKTEFRFTIMAYNNPVTRSYLAIYKAALRTIGVDMTPSYMDWSLMQKQMDARKFDAFTGGWGLSWSTDPYQLWHSSQADIVKGSNRVGFRNERADQIIEKLRVTFDEPARIKLLQEFHMILHQKQPYTFLYQPKTPFAWQSYMKNMVFQKLRPQDLSLPWWIGQQTP